MRERTLSLKVQGGDRVSAEYLAATLYRRAQSLVDDPASSLFFGRIDMTGDGDDRERFERWYIGRRHVADAEGEPVVIDWRADVSRAFYRATAPSPWGCGCGGGSACSRGSSPRTRTSTSPTRAEADPRAAAILAERDRAAARRPDARHRRHHPARAGRDRPGRRSRPPCASRARPAPARRRSACTAPPGCSTPTATGCPAAASSWSARTGRSSSTSATCCPRWVRSRCTARTTVDELVAHR